MSTNLNYKQVLNVERRTWDLEAYEKRAQERLKASTDGGKKKRKKSISNHDDDGNQGPFFDNNEEGTKEEFMPAAPGAAKAHKSDRAFLKSRSKKVDVDSKIGSVEIVNPESVATTKSKADEPGVEKDSAVTKTGIGWHCKVCDCFLRDSHTYLDHINGRKHQRNLGYSMRVERSTKDQVTSRLEALAKEKEEASNKNLLVDEEEEDFFDVVKARDEEAKRQKEERARKRKERRKEKKAAARGQQQQQSPAADKTTEAQSKDDGEERGGGEEEVEEGGVDPALAAMMGFSGFGGGNKNH